MRIHRPVAAALSFMLCTLTLTGCGGSGGPGGGSTPCQVTSVTVTAAATSVNPDQKTNLSASVTSTGTCAGGLLERIAVRWDADHERADGYLFGHRSAKLHAHRDQRG